jgi:hypothetical protein
MSQVMIVCINTGSFYYLNADGSRLGPMDSGFLNDQDARVLINRIEAGYTEIPPAHYAVCLAHNGTYPDDYFEIETIVDYWLQPVVDGPGSERILVRQDLVPREEWCTFDIRKDMSVYTHRLARIDYDAQVLQWMVNPWLEDPYTNEVKEAVSAQGETELSDMLCYAKRILEKECSAPVSLIEVVHRH